MDKKTKDSALFEASRVFNRRISTGEYNGATKEIIETFMRCIDLPEGTQRLVTTIKEFIMSRAFSPDGAEVRDLLMSAVQVIELQATTISIMEGVEKQSFTLEEITNELMEEFKKNIEEFNVRNGKGGDFAVSMANSVGDEILKETINELHKTIDMKDNMIQKMKEEIVYWKGELRDQGARDKEILKETEKKLHSCRTKIAGAMLSETRQEAKCGWIAFAPASGEYFWTSAKADFENEEFDGLRPATNVECFLMNKIGNSTMYADQGREPYLYYGRVLYAKVWDSVSSIIKKHSPDDRVEILGNESLKGMGCKPIHLMRIAIEIEKAFDIEFDHEDVIEWDTLRSILDSVMNIIPSGKRAPPEAKANADGRPPKPRA